ncbi:MAG: hypothetical protein ACM3ZR_12825 [Pseudomonadota bacterium]
MAMELRCLKDKSVDKGSFTIEAAMIFTSVVFAVLTLLFTFVYLQQKAYLTGAAVSAAELGAELWASRLGVIENPIGYRLFDNLLMSQRSYEGLLEKEKDADGRQRLVLRMDPDDSLPGQKMALIGEALGKQLVRASLKTGTTRVRMTFSNSGLRERLVVEIIQEVRIPLGSIKKLLDGKDTLTLCSRAEASVTEPAEYIRNIDLAMELSERFKERLDLAGLMEMLGKNGQK